MAVALQGSHGQRNHHRFSSSARAVDAARSLSATQVPHSPAAEPRLGTPRSAKTVSCSLTEHASGPQDNAQSGGLTLSKRTTSRLLRMPLKAEGNSTNHQSCRGEHDPDPGRPLISVASSEHESAEPGPAALAMFSVEWFSAPGQRLALLGDIHQPACRAGTISEPTVPREEHPEDRRRLGLHEPSEGRQESPSRRPDRLPALPSSARSANRPPNTIPTVIPMP